MPCSCGHINIEHLEQNGSCQKCDCKKYRLIPDENSKKQPWYIKPAVANLRGAIKDVEDLLQDMRLPGTLSVHAKEYRQEMKDGTTARGVEVAVIIAENGFETGWWIEDRVDDSHNKQIMAEFTAGELIHLRPKSLLSVLWTCKTKSKPKGECEICQAREFCDPFFTIAEDKLKELADKEVSDVHQEQTTGGAEGQAQVPAEAKAEVGGAGPELRTV